MSPSEVPSASKAVKEWHSAGSTHSFSILCFPIPALGYCCSQWNLIQSTWRLSDGQFCILCLKSCWKDLRLAGAGCRKNYFIMGAQRSSAKINKVHQNFLCCPAKNTLWDMEKHIFKWNSNQSILYHVSKGVLFATWKCFLSWKVFIAFIVPFSCNFFQ